MCMQSPIQKAADNPDTTFRESRLYDDMHILAFLPTLTDEWILKKLIYER
jgi:hypothetical protein